MEKKQKYLLLLAIVIVIGLLIISSLVAKKDDGGLITDEPTVIFENAQKESATVKKSETKDFINITANDYLNYYNGSEKQIVLIGRPTCQYSNIAEPILKNIAYKKKIDICYLNTDELTPEEEESIIASNEFFQDSLGTPILLVIGEGKIIDKVDGATDTNHYLEFLKNNGFIK